jgi:hypothetical protein
MMAVAMAASSESVVTSRTNEPSIFNDPQGNLLR